MTRENFREHGGGNLILEAQCHSGVNHDCEGAANLVSCCQGHYEGSQVGPTDQCSWEYFGHGQQMECGASDEIMVGRCGSGMNRPVFPTLIARERQSNAGASNLMPKRTSVP